MLHARFYPPIIQSRSYFSADRKGGGRGGRLLVDGELVDRVFAVAIPPFPWRYTTHNGCVFYSPLSGFSLHA